MVLKIYQIDAFATKSFEGNPAAVVPLDDWIPDKIMQNIAEENNLSETAFFIGDGDDYHIRWFTPKKEVQLCGSATLASAFVIYEILKKKTDKIKFKSLSGPLYVKKNDRLLRMSFPSQKPKECNMPQILLGAIDQKPKFCYSSEDYIAIYSTEDEISQIKPDFKKLKRLDLRGLIVTAPGKDYDFVSRAFFPKYGIPEDPVTGSAHTQLVPYWSEIFGKTELKARQISKRGGDIFCEYNDDRVIISGFAKLYLSGEIEIYSC